MYASSTFFDILAIQIQDKVIQAFNMQDLINDTQVLNPFHVKTINADNFKISVYDVLFLCAPLLHKAVAYKIRFQSAVSPWEVTEVQRPSWNVEGSAVSPEKKSDQILSSLEP